MIGCIAGIRAPIRVPCHWTKPSSWSLAYRLKLLASRFQPAGTYRRNSVCITSKSISLERTSLAQQVPYWRSHTRSDSQTLKHSLRHPVRHPVRHWLSDFSDWVTDWLTHWLTDSLTHSLTDSLTHWLTHSLTHSLTTFLPGWCRE